MRRTLLGLAGPVYLELLSGIVAGIVDTLWVARLGRAAIAAVAVASTVENVLLGLILTAGIGTTVLIARSAGSLRAAMRAAALLWVVITPVVAVGGFLTRESIAQALGGGDPVAVHLTASFLAVSFPGIALFFAQNVVDGIFKGTGDTRTPMRAALLANAVLLVLDPLLIYGWAGLPRLGVTGAAIAVVVSRAPALLASLYLLRRRHRVLGPSELTVRQALGRILAVGVPTSADFVVRMLIGLSMVALTARFGTAQLAAYGIGTRMMLLATMAFYAVRQAASIHISRAPSTVAATGSQALLLALGAAALADAILLGAPQPLLTLFTSDPAVQQQGVLVLRYLALYLPALAGVVALAGVLLAGGLARRMLAVTVIGAAVQIPLGWALGRTALGAQGVWLAMSVGAAAQLALSLDAFRRHRHATEPQRRAVEARPASPTRRHSPLPQSCSGPDPLKTLPNAGWWRRG